MPMPIPAKRVPPALKHGAYSKFVLLPGEDPAEFEELHRDLIADLAPNGRMEEETVASIAHLVWRRQNFAMMADSLMADSLMANSLMANSLEKAGTKQSANSKEDWRFGPSFLEKLHKAQRDREEEVLAERHEIAKEETLNRLMKVLELEERLNAMIDRLIKRLLTLRGLKSITSSPTTTHP